ASSDPTTSSSTLLAFTSLSSLCLSLLFIYAIRHYWRSRIQTSIQMTKMACQVLFENPSLFYVSYGLLFLYFLYVTIWFYLFVYLLLIGSEDHGPGTWHLLLRS